MNVMIIRDAVCRQNFTMMAGSVIRDVHELLSSYRGVFYPEHGGNPYWVTVPKEDCEVLDAIPLDS